MLEIGRLCAADVTFRFEALRACWGALAQIVDRKSVVLMFGCSSFEGVEPACYQDAFAFLAENHRAPDALIPRKRSAETFDLPKGHPFDKKRAIAQLPPLLRTYLSLGGWVSDHAVVDRNLNTLHVLTALEIAAIQKLGRVLCARWFDLDACAAAASCVADANGAHSTTPTQ